MTTNTPRIRIATDGKKARHIVVPISQLEKVEEMLKANNIVYWLDEEVLSIDGKEEVAFVNLSRNSNTDNLPELVERLS